MMATYAEAHALAGVKLRLDEEGEFWSGPSLTAKGHVGLQIVPIKSIPIRACGKRINDQILQSECLSLLEI